MRVVQLSHGDTAHNFVGPSDAHVIPEFPTREPHEKALVVKVGGSSQGYGDIRENDL